MSGSLKWTKYQSDDGVDYAFFQDESNAEVEIDGSPNFDDYEAGDANAVIPKTMKPRYANLARIDAGTRSSRKLYIGKRTTYEFLAASNNATVTLNGQVWSVSSLRGEKNRKPISLDTNYDDGDIT